MNIVFLVAARPLRGFMSTLNFSCLPLIVGLVVGPCGIGREERDWQGGV